MRTESARQEENTGRVHVLWYVLCEEEFVGGRIFAETMFGRRARIHESLGDDRQAWIDGGRLVDVKDKVGVLDEIDPEPQRQAAHDEQRTKDSSVRQSVGSPVEWLWCGHRFLSTRFTCWISRRAALRDPECRACEPLRPEGQRAIW